MFEGYATRAGVFLYRRADGSVARELRPVEEVSRADSLATLGRKPYTDDHPPEFVTPKNAKKYQDGTIGENIVWEARGAGGFVKVTGIVTDEKAIREIEDGKRELSCGYVCEVEDSAGVHPEFGPYDRIQRNIRYNHLAGVRQGRAGPDVKMNMDSADDAVMVFDGATNFRDLPLAPAKHRWDKPNAARRLRKWAGVADGPNGLWRIGFLWYDTDSQDDFKAYKFQFVDVVDGRLMAVPQAILEAKEKIREGGDSLGIPAFDLELIRSHIDRYLTKMREESEGLTLPETFDSNDSPPRTSNAQTRRDSMLVSVEINGVRFDEVDPSLAQAITALKEKKDAAETRADKAEADRDEAKATAAKYDGLLAKVSPVEGKTTEEVLTAKLDGFDALEAERDQLKKDNADLAKRADSVSGDDISARLEILTVAKTLKVDGLGDEPLKCQLSNDDLRKKIVAKEYSKLDGFDIEQKNDSYIEAAYDNIRRDLAGRKQKTDSLGGALLSSGQTPPAQREDDEESKLDEAQKGYQERMKAQHVNYQNKDSE